MTHELDKFKERAELGGRGAAQWWSEVREQLDGECGALQARIEETVVKEERIISEVATLAARHDASSDSHDEVRLREKERELERTRRERGESRGRLERVQAEREAKYHMARTTAEAFNDYYESLMRSYCAANRKAPSLDGVAKPELPSQLQHSAFAGEPGPTSAPAST